MTPKQARTKRPGKPKPEPLPLDAPTQALWQQVHPLGALRVEPHHDSGGWTVVFPFPMLGIATASQLSEHVLAALPQHVPTAFGAGRWTKPNAWYVTVAAR